MDYYELAKKALEDKDYEKAESLFLKAIYIASNDDNYLLTDRNRIVCTGSLKYLSQSIYPVFFDKYDRANLFYKIWSEKSPDVTLGYVYALASNRKFKDAYIQLYKIKDFFPEEFYVSTASLIMLEKLNRISKIDVAILFKYCVLNNYRTDISKPRFDLLTNELTHDEIKKLDSLKSDDIAYKVDDLIKIIYREFVSSTNFSEYYIKNMKNELLDLLGFNDNEVVLNTKKQKPNL
jgi:hypothetical protein